MTAGRLVLIAHIRTVSSNSFPRPWPSGLRCSRPRSTNEPSAGAEHLGQADRDETEDHGPFSPISRLSVSTPGQDRAQMWGDPSGTRRPTAGSTSPQAVPPEVIYEDRRSRSVVSGWVLIADI